MAREKYAYSVIIIIKPLCWNLVAVINQLVTEAVHRAGATAEATASREAKCVFEQIAAVETLGVSKLPSRLLLSDFSRISNIHLYSP